MAAADPIAGQPYGIDSPATYALAVTPNDSTDLTVVTRGLWVGGAGTVVATMRGGGDVTFSGVPAGTILPISVSRVKTSSTATLIVALW